MTRLFGHRCFSAIAAVAIVLGLAAGAWAYFTSTGAGNAGASVGTLNPPTNVSANASGGTVAVTWTPSITGSGAVAPAGYYVSRTSSDGTTSAACGSSATSLVTSGTSCSDASVPAGTYTYAVVAVYHTWTATGKSSPVTVSYAADGSGTMSTTTSSVTAGSSANTITFTYTAAGGVSGGSISLAVPSGWSVPSTTSTAGGYTTASTGTVGVSGQTITVSGVTLTAGATMTITYASTAGSGPGATAPTTAAQQLWTTHEQSTTSGTLTGLSSSPSITVSPAGLSSFLLTTESSHTAGSAFPVTITANDQYGNTVTSYTGTHCLTFSGPATSPGGTAPSYPPAGTCAAGSALNFSGGQTSGPITLYAAASSLTLTVTDASASRTGSSTLSVSAASASKLAITSTSVSGAASTTANLGPLTVIEQDAYGNASTTAETVNLSSSSTAGVFSATKNGSTIASVTIPAGSSSASLYYGDAKAGSPILTAGATGLTSATQTETIGAGQLVFTTQPGGAVRGTAFTSQPVVKAEDLNGNVVTTYTGTISLSIKTSTGTSGAALSGCSPTLTSGVASFTSCQIDKSGSGYQLSASDGTLSGTSSGFNVFPRPPSSVTLVNGGGTGAAYIDSANKSSVSVDVALPATSLASDTVKLTITDPGATHTVTASQTATAGAGTLHFTGLDLSTLNDGTITMSAAVTDGGSLASGSSSTTAPKDTVAPDAPTSVAISNGGGTGSAYINAANKSSASFNVGWTASINNASSDTITVTLTNASSSVSATATRGSSSPTAVTTVNTSGLADGSLAVTAKATDAAGNSSTTYTGTAVTKDTVANAPGGIYNDLSGNNPDTITVTGETGASITITETAPRSAISYSGTISSGTSTTVTVDTLKGGSGKNAIAYSYSITQTDLAGNTSTAAPLTGSDTS